MSKQSCLYKMVKLIFSDDTSKIFYIGSSSIVGCRHKGSRPVRLEFQFRYDEMNAKDIELLKSNVLPVMDQTGTISFKESIDE